MLLTVLWLVPAGFSYAQTPHAIDTGLRGGYSIDGHVLMPSGRRPERRLRIKIEMLMRANVNGTTNEVGNFRFVGLIPGDYILSVEEDEFLPVRMPITVHETIGVPISPGDVSIRLAYKPQAIVPPAALDHYNKAGDLARAGDHQAAIEELKRAVRAHPTFMLALNELGVQHMRAGDLSSSRQALQAALDLEPNALAPLINLGMVNVMLKDYKSAVAPLKKAIKLDTNSRVGHYFLGQALANLGEFEDARRSLLFALGSGNDEMKEAHRILAIIFNNKGDKKRAIEHLETYLRLAPDASDAEQLRTVLQKLKEVK